MPSFADALRVLNDMKDSGVVEDYAVAGAMAMVFWAEPIPTYDLDVLVFAAGRGYATQAEHVIIEGVPVQFLPAHNSLAEEAIDRAVTLEYESVPVRVVRPEYLVGLYLEPGARTLKRRERAAALMESSALDRAVLDELLKRFKLEPLETWSRHREDGRGQAQDSWMPSARARRLCGGSGKSWTYTKRFRSSSRCSGSVCP